MARLLTCPLVNQYIDCATPYATAYNSTGWTLNGGGTAATMGTGLLNCTTSGYTTCYATLALPLADGTYFLRARTNCTTYTSSMASIVNVAGSTSIAIKAGTGNFVTLVINSTEQIQAQQIVTNGRSLWLGIAITISGSNITAAGLWVDGVDYGTVTGLSIGVSALVWTFGFVTAASSLTQIYTDIAVNDSSGASETSYPPMARTTILLPTGNSSVGNWKSGTGTSATNDGYQYLCVDNVPPTATATPNAAGASGTAIGNNVSGASNAGRGDFTMETYASKGIRPFDTINCITMIVGHGEDIRTGTKTGDFNILSNPAQSGTDTIGTGGASAYGAADAVGTFPSFWVIQSGAPQYLPTVDTAAAPACRVNKTDTGTRYADICFIGLVIEYIPGLLEPIAQPLQRNPSGWWDQSRRY